MVFPEWVLKFKEPKTEIKYIKGCYYKYAIAYRYNPQKKRTDKITKELLGKITENEGFIPSNKLQLKRDATILPRVDIKNYGIYRLFTSLLGDECKDLLSIFSAEISQVLLVVAMMRFAFHHPLKRMSYEHAHDFCSQDWAINGLNDKKITSALKHVGENRNILVDWMKSRLGINDMKLNNFVMIDSTHIHSLSEHLHINATGYNPQHNYDKQIRLMYIFSAQLKLPIYYRLINGNITDLTSMKTCAEELGVENVVFIADKGFYSKKNTTDLRSNHLYYIIPLQRDNNLIDFGPLQAANFKKNLRTHFIYQNRVIWYYSYEKNGEKLTTFLDETLRLEEENDYLTRTKTQPDAYKEDNFFEKMHQFGTLTITSYLPEELTPQQLYETYKQRNEIEMMFDAYKNVLKADVTYMQNRYVMEGWLMANFIAMTAYYRLYQRLKEAKMLSKYAPKDILQISRSIHKLKINNIWKTSEITKKDTELLKKIKIDYLT